jgi:hypothetical protein
MRRKWSAPPGSSPRAKGKAHRPYEFGVKVSVATTLAHARGGQFVTHVKALPGNPYDGHTLAASYAGDWVTRSIRRRGEPAFR